MHDNACTEITQCCEMRLGWYLYSCRTYIQDGMHTTPLTALTLLYIANIYLG